ncbi:hypothetical protein [Nocardioides dilutus]
MIRQPSRRAVLAVRAVKMAATTALAGTAIALTLGGAIANPAGDRPSSTDASARLAERAGTDSRCAGASGKTIVRTPRGETKAVSFERGWRIFRGERPGTLVVVCPD